MPLNTCQSDATDVACDAANGLPPNTQTTYGTVAPDGNVYGYRIGDLYVRTDTSKMYFFNGTPRTTSGWVILN